MKGGKGSTSRCARRRVLFHFSAAIVAVIPFIECPPKTAIEVNLDRFRLAKFPNGNETLDGGVHADWLDGNAITNLHMSLHATASLRGDVDHRASNAFYTLGLLQREALAGHNGPVTMKSRLM